MACIIISSIVILTARQIIELMGSSDVTILDQLLPPGLFDHLFVETINAGIESETKKAG